MWRARAWSEGARGEGCAACEGPREEVARAALHARGARAMTGAWGEGARVAGAREGWRGLQGRGARAHAWQAALHARGRARGWRGLRFMRGGRGQWRGRGARMHARKEHTHLQKEAGCWRLDEGSDGDASALDRRCDSLLVCVMCRAHNESRAPPTSCTREGEHEGTRARRDERCKHATNCVQARCERAGCLGNSSLLRCEFWRQVFCVLFVPGVTRIFHARTFRQKKHRLLANMKRLYQRSF